MNHFPEGWPGTSRPSAVLALAAVAIAAVVAVGWIGSLSTQAAPQGHSQVAGASNIGALLSDFNQGDAAPGLPPLAPTAEDAPAAPTF